MRQIRTEDLLCRRSAPVGDQNVRNSGGDDGDSDELGIPLLELLPYSISEDESRASYQNPIRVMYMSCREDQERQVALSSQPIGCCSRCVSASIKAVTSDEIC